MHQADGPFDSQNLPAHLAYLKIIRVLPAQGQDNIIIADTCFLQNKLPAGISQNRVHIVGGAEMLTECFVRIDYSYLIFFLHQKADEKIRIFSPQRHCYLHAHTATSLLTVSARRP